VIMLLLGQSFLLSAVAKSVFILKSTIIIAVNSACFFLKDDYINPFLDRGFVHCS